MQAVTRYEISGTSLTSQKGCSYEDSPDDFGTKQYTIPDLVPTRICFSYSSLRPSLSKSISTQFRPISEECCVNGYL